jgi:peptidoglycan hydrolase-like protein with peptidoglycan-binding domain
MAKSAKGPLLALAALGAGAFALLSSKKAGASPRPATLPATPAPSGVSSETVSINGHTWKLVPVSGGVDVFAPAGSWGPHGELRVLRFTQVSNSAPRVLAGVAEGVPKTVLDAAMKDLAIKAPAGPTVTTPPGRPPMPSSLAAELVSAMMALGVDSNGVVRGPVTAAAVRHATELSSRLEQAGYPEAAAALRGYAQQASKLLPPPSAPAPVVPGVPAALMAQIQKALELERDPAKLEALKAALGTLPASAERDMLIGALGALILQIRSAQAISTAATEIDEQMKQPPGESGPKSASGARILKLVRPNMKGEDVAVWQQVLRASGYPIDADGVFGPATDAATIDWQKKRGLTGDGDVGPATRAKIGTPPTAPMTVPASASPRPDPKPKTALEVSADVAATHLLALQEKHGVKGSKGRQDMTLVKRFQTAAGGSPDGLPGPGTILALARAGVGILPAVMYWPKNATRSKDLPAFRSALGSIAASARSAGMTTLAAQLDASAARETGAGGLA